MKISFETTKEDRDLILKIADRACHVAAAAGVHINKVDMVMDITATHANGCPLRLDELLNADSFNFAHDVFGIKRHLDRRTGRINNFLPRFAQLTEKA